MEKSYNLNLEEVAKNLNTSLENGLQSNEAKIRLQKYGLNVLKESKGMSPFIIFFSQFRSVLVIILILASLASYLLGEKLDALMIFAIVAINAVVGFIQEYRVEKAISHLKKLISQNARVYRDGNLKQVPSSELVVGDLIVIEEGQKVAADIRLTKVINLKTIEASLTGESTPITKELNPLKGEIPIADQKNILFSGTVVSGGKGMGIVVATGMQTEIGKIAHLVSTQIDPTTPMQEKLNHLGGLIGKIVLVIAAVVGLEEMFFGEQVFINALVSSVALAVAAIPEGLPAVVTISLALGTKRLLKQNALIRNLPAAETLGSVDYICVDKTGTLTEGAMSVTKIYINGSLIDVEEQKNEQSSSSNKQSFSSNKTHSKELEKILLFGFLSSNARQSGEEIIGDPTEAAFIQTTLDFGYNQTELIKKYTRVTEVPFSSDRKMMSTVSKEGDKNLVTSKGATEVILNLCSKIEINGKIVELTGELRDEILKVNEDMASDALRVLAFAYKYSNSTDEASLEKDLIFLGLQGMIDPPRKGVKEAIGVCQKSSGIKVVMLTGDHLLTAKAIASEVGIVGENITGVELNELSDEEFKQKVEQISIYARVNPEHKIRIVKALQELGHQVAMSGDGVNDAPALKAADIGVAMGITGTDVAKESSDMILLDDHFNTIVAAVREGRAIYDNIRKFVNYLLSSNMMEVAVIFIAIIFGWGLPLLPIHLLWVNLVTDGLPAIALGVDPARGNIMNSPPKEFKEEIVTKRFFIRMALSSAVLTIAVLSLFFLYKDASLIKAQTIAFSAVVLYEMLRLIEIRSSYNLSFFSNKFLNLAVFSSIALQLIILYLPLSIGGVTLQSLFKIEALALNDWIYLLGAGVLVFLTLKTISFVKNPAFIHKT